MALHGKIEVNDQPIGTWCAIWQMPKGWTPPKPRPQDEFNYVCEVQMGRTPEGNPAFYWSGTVRHRFGDGALVLANKVLAAALAPPLEDD